MNKPDLMIQFAQSMKILEEIVKNVDDDLWRNGGCGYQTPGRIAYHILLGVEYYIGYESSLKRVTGDDWETIPKESLPPPKDILQLIDELNVQIKEWISALDLAGDNKQFPWAGKSNTGLFMFLLRHTMYHIGELNAILYQAKGGHIDDLYMAGFRVED